MKKIFRFMAMLAIVVSPPVPAHALELVEWAAPAASPGLLTAWPTAGGAERREAVDFALQHGDGTVEWDRLVVRDPAPPAAEPALASPGSSPPPPDSPGPPEPERGPGLLAGLAAAALLMWRRLRHH